MLEWISPGDLNVDDEYQRSLESENSLTLIRRIAQFWDWGLCQPVNVARRADGSLWIVDGQHRRAAAVMRGDIPHLPCVVLTFMSKGEEAAAFVALNKQRRALNSVDVFKASLAAGDLDAKAIMEVITASGLSIAPHSNYVAWQPGMLYCIPTIQAGYRKHGRLVVSSALVAFSEAFAGQVLQYAGNLLTGLIAFYAAELREDAFDADVFIDTLSLVSQAEWLRRARLRVVQTGQSLRDAMHAMFTDAYLAALATKLEVAA